MQDEEYHEEQVDKAMTGRSHAERNEHPQCPPSPRLPFIDSHAEQNEPRQCPPSPRLPLIDDFAPILPSVPRQWAGEQGNCQLVGQNMGEPYQVQQASLFKTEAEAIEHAILASMEDTKAQPTSPSKATDAAKDPCRGDGESEIQPPEAREQTIARARELLSRGSLIHEGARQAWLEALEDHVTSRAVVDIEVAPWVLDVLEAIIDLPDESKQLIASSSMGELLPDMIDALVSAHRTRSDEELQKVAEVVHLPSLPDLVEMRQLEADATPAQEAEMRSRLWPAFCHIVEETSSTSSSSSDSDGSHSKNAEIPGQRQPTQGLSDLRRVRDYCQATVLAKQQQLCDEDIISTNNYIETIDPNSPLVEQIYLWRRLSLVLDLPQPSLAAVLGDLLIPLKHLASRLLTAIQKCEYRQKGFPQKLAHIITQDQIHALVSERIGAGLPDEVV